MDVSHSVNAANAAADMLYDWPDFVFLQSVNCFEFGEERTFAPEFDEDVELQLIMEKAIEADDVEVLHSTVNFELLRDLSLEALLPYDAFVYYLHCADEPCCFVPVIII